MVHLELLDGTRNLKYGRALVGALSEIAKYQRVTISPEPGGIDMPGYRFVKRAEIGVFNRARGQVCGEGLLDNILRNSNVAGRNSITLTELDLYDEGLNWYFGFSTRDTLGGSHVLLSTYRLNDPPLFVHLATHELGHMRGAASEGRSNTENNLGSHCTNTCVMEQRLTVSGMMNHAQRLSGRHDKFCYQCANELKRNR